MLLLVILISYQVRTQLSKRGARTYLKSLQNHLRKVSTLKGKKKKRLLWWKRYFSSLPLGPRLCGVGNKRIFLQWL